MFSLLNEPEDVHWTKGKVRDENKYISGKMAVWVSLSVCVCVLADLTGLLFYAGFFFFFFTPSHSHQCQAVHQMSITGSWWMKASENRGQKTSGKTHVFHNWGARLIGLSRRASAERWHTCDYLCITEDDKGLYSAHLKYLQKSCEALSHREMNE